MKRVLLGIAIAAAAAFSATPASAEDPVQWCGFTPAMPCGVCPVRPDDCLWF